MKGWGLVGLLLLLGVTLGTGVGDLYDGQPTGCGLSSRTETETAAMARTRRTRRCAPRGELKAELQHQYSLAQVDGIVQHIKRRLDQLSSGKPRRIKRASPSAGH